MRYKKTAVIAIIATGLIIRFIRIGQPLTEFSTRQVETAMVARNFYNHGFKIFSPEMDFASGKGEGSVFALELGIVPFIAAFLYKISGGVHEYWGRIVSILFWAGSALIFYKWLLFFSERLAVYGLAVYTFLPLSIILSRTFQPEMAMLFFSILGLYFLTRYSLKEHEISLWLGAISISMAILLKLTAVSLTLPFIYTVLRKELLTRKKSQWIKFGIACLLTVSLPLVWYSRGLLLSRIYPSQISSSNWAIGNWFDFSSWFKPENWRDIFNNLWGIALTPVGFTLFLSGVFLRKKTSTEYLFYYWVLGVAISILLFFYHSRTHAYYWLPLIPAASYFIAGCLISLEESHAREKLFRNFIAKTTLILIVAAMLFYYIYPAYRVPRAYAKAGAVADAVNSRVSAGSLIIASCSSGPYLLYYCNRRGWDFWVNATDTNHIEYLESLRGMGAEYFVSANLEELNTNRALTKHLYENYDVIWEKKSTGVIFSLR